MTTNLKELDADGRRMATALMATGCYHETEEDAQWLASDASHIVAELRRDPIPARAIIRALEDSGAIGSGFLSEETALVRAAASCWKEMMSL